MSIGRIPPHSAQAEEHLLSAAMIDGPDVITRAVAAGVTPESFYVPANRVLFAMMLDQFTRAEPFGIAEIGILLNERKQLDEVGGYSYLTRISGSAATTANTPFHIERVIELSQLRKAIIAATAVVESCYAYTGGVPREHLGRDIDRLNEAVANHATARSWKDAVKEARAVAVERMKPAADRSANQWAIDWPWLDLQKCLLPIEPGELVVIAARPSVGKSSLARQLAWSCVDGGIPTLFHTLEVGDSELATNLAANISGRQSRRDLDRMHPADQAELLAAYDAMETPSAPFQAIGEDDTALSIISRARAFKARHGMRLWIVDHLGLIADCINTNRGENVATATGRVTRALKRFATTERVPVVLLCQLNRGAEGRDGPPMLSHLRDSGRIEEDANRVIFLHRPTEYHAGGVRYEQDPYSSPADEPTHYIEVIQAKGRNTGTSTVALSFHRPTATFRNFLGN